MSELNCIDARNQLDKVFSVFRFDFSQTNPKHMPGALHARSLDTTQKHLSQTHGRENKHQSAAYMICMSSGHFVEACSMMDKIREI
jgi:hypothetical protein